MSWILAADCLWVLVAGLIGMLPSTDHHWTAARWLIAALVPLVGFSFWLEPWWLGTALLVAAASILRWPLWFALRWVWGRVTAG
ncbi:DUF2484 family protein [Pseudoroseicyclus sp. CXY001]|uniref:DUF2484 family protein n=1 Tax=Pseudoroseicyclus sp. CXY001 TaxID=3242492 RepID=UPI0035714E3F